MCLCISSPVHLTTMCYQCKVNMFCTQYAIPVSHLGVIVPLPPIFPMPLHTHIPPPHIPLHSPLTLMPLPTHPPHPHLHSLRPTSCTVNAVKCAGSCNTRSKTQSEPSRRASLKQKGCVYTRTLVSTLCTTRTASVHRNADQG